MLPKDGHFFFDVVKLSHRALEALVEPLLRQGQRYLDLSYVLLLHRRWRIELGLAGHPPSFYRRLNSRIIDSGREADIVSLRRRRCALRFPLFPLVPFFFQVSEACVGFRG